MTFDDFYIGPEKYKSDTLNEIEAKLHDTLQKYAYKENTKQLREKMRYDCQEVLEPYIERCFVSASMKDCITVKGDESSAVIELTPLTQSPIYEELNAYKQQKVTLRELLNEYEFQKMENEGNTYLRIREDDPILDEPISNKYINLLLNKYKI